jgi:hypothetical protein
MPTYFLLILWYYFPYEFSGINSWQMNLKIFGMFWMTAFFPAFAVFLLWRLKMIDSIFLRTQKERIIPYFVTMFFYWWMYYLSRNFTDQPLVLKFFFFGIFICVSIAVILNNYFKISMHAMGVGGLATALILTAFYYQINLGLPIALLVLLAGAVVTARLVLGEHQEREVYAGLLLGIFCQLISYYIIL